MGMTRIAAILSLSLAIYATLHYTEANPDRSLDINSVFLGLCPRYLEHLEISEQDKCTEEFIAGIMNELKDIASATDTIVYLTLAEDGKLGLQTADPVDFDSACEILEHFCTPLIRLPDNARFRRQASDSNSNSTSASGSGSASGEST